MGQKQGAGPAAMQAPVGMSGQGQIAPPSWEELPASSGVPASQATSVGQKQGAEPGVVQAPAGTSGQEQMTPPSSEGLPPSLSPGQAAAETRVPAAAASQEVQ